MPSVINRFAAAAQSAYGSFPKQSLIADSKGLIISLRRAFYDQISSQYQHENRHTWKLFRKKLVNVIGKEKFEWICNRYSFDYSACEKSGIPFLPKHIKIFSVGTSQVRTADVKDYRFAKVRYMKMAELTKRVAKCQPVPIIGETINPFNLFSCASKVKAWLFHDILLMDEEKQSLFADTHTLNFYQYLERFSKVTANRELFEGQLIPAIAKSGRLEYYKVYKKIATGKGLVAYGLTPATHDSTLKPMLVFRPTQLGLSNEDAVETLCDDFREKIGSVGYESAHPHLQRLMEDTKFCSAKRKIRISGFSYGGVCAQRFLADFHKKVDHAIFYGDPSVDRETAERFANEINHSARRKNSPLLIEIFRIKRDLCDHVGDCHIGWNVRHPDVNIRLVEIDHWDKNISAFYLHAFRFHDTKTPNYTTKTYSAVKDLFKQLDNSRRSVDVRWYYQAHKVWGRAVYLSILTLHYFFKGFTKVSGIQILRNSIEILNESVKENEALGKTHTVL